MTKCSNVVLPLWGNSFLFVFPFKNVWLLGSLFYCKKYSLVKIEFDYSGANFLDKLFLLKT